MIAWLRKWGKRCAGRRHVSPAGFFRRAVILLVVFLVLHFAGLRDYTSVICGSSPSGGSADKFTAVLGCGYAVIYMMTVMAVPILLLACLIFCALSARRKPTFPLDGE